MLSSYENRRNTLKRKASQLSSLCDVQVCVLVFGPDGDFTSWPENPSDVIDAFQKASAAGKNKRRRRTKEKLDLSDIMDSEVKSLRKQLSDQSITTSDPLALWDDDQLDLLSTESLLALSSSLESKIHSIDSRIGVLSSQSDRSGDEQEFSEYLQSLLQADELVPGQLGF